MDCNPKQTQNIIQNERTQFIIIPSSHLQVLDCSFSHDTPLSLTGRESFWNRSGGVSFRHLPCRKILVPANKSRADSGIIYLPKEMKDDGSKWGHTVTPPGAAFSWRRREVEQSKHKCIVYFVKVTQWRMWSRCPPRTFLRIISEGSRLVSQ